MPNYEELKNTMTSKIDILLISKDNFSRDSLRDFNRFQTVNNVYRLVNGKLQLFSDSFTEYWSPERKIEKADEILSDVFITYCAFDGKRVVGEIMLLPTLDNGRLIIDSFAISAEYRRHGIGRALFEKAREEARNRGADRLYMSACPAEETVNFYLAMGCYPSPSPIKFYVEEESCDIQMECMV